MKMEKRASHVACQFETETVFELGYKVLTKQQIPNTLPCIRIQYNLKDRFLFETDQLYSLDTCLTILNKKEILHVVISLLKVMMELDHSGFVPIEALIPDIKCIFINRERQEVKFIVLPITQEYISEDLKSWHRRYLDTMNYLTEQLSEDVSDEIREHINHDGKYMDYVPRLIERLSERESTPRFTDTVMYNNTAEPQLRLIHNGMYGQIVLQVEKREYVIGKKRDSVDGFIGVSNAVSRQHCKVNRRSGHFYIIDLNSSNHTYVNSTMVSSTQERELKNGDRVRIADLDFSVQIVS